MTLIRTINRILNMISFLVSKYIIFVYDRKIRIYKQEPIDGEVISNHIEYISRYSQSVVPDSDAVEALYKFLELDKKSKQDKIKAILAFVHSIPYTRDTRYPSGDDVKTLYGSLRTCKLDCEDSAICITTMLIRCGMSAHLVFVERPRGSNKTNHCVACLSEDDLDILDGSYATKMGKRFYLIEGTAERKIGDIGKKYAGWSLYLIDCSEVAK